MYGMPHQSSWTQYTPIPITADDPIPRVAAYVSRACTNIRVTQRSDIISHRDILILEVHLSTRLSFLVVNIYNDSNSTALDVLISLPLPELPSIVSGDFNLHHSSWSREIKPPPTSSRFEDLINWMDGGRFRLINQRGEITFFRSAATSVLDLTWVNHSALNLGTFREWCVREDLVMGSDHIPVTWELYFSPDDVPFTPMTTPFKFDDEKSLDWTNAYARCLEGQRRTQPEPDDQEDDLAVLNRLTENVMGAMEQASDQCLRRTKFHPKASPWYTEEVARAIAEVRHQRDRTKRMFAALDGPRPTRTRGPTCPITGGPSQKCELYTQTSAVSDDTHPCNVLRDYRTATKNQRKAVRKAKTDWAMEFTGSVEPRDVWKLTSWYRGVRRHTAPPLNRPDGSKAVTPEEKADTLFGSLFQPPPTLDDEQGADPVLPNSCGCNFSC